MLTRQKSLARTQRQDWGWKTCKKFVRTESNCSLEIHEDKIKLKLKRRMSMRKYTIKARGILRVREKA